MVKKFTIHKNINENLLTNYYKFKNKNKVNIQSNDNIDPFSLDPFDEEEWDEVDYEIIIYQDDETGLEFEWLPTKNEFNGWRIRNIYSRKIKEYIRNKYPKHHKDNLFVLTGYTVREKMIDYNKQINNHTLINSEHRNIHHNTFLDNETGLEFEWLPTNNEFNGWRIRNIYSRKIKEYIRNEYPKHYNDNLFILIGYTIREKMIEYDKLIS